MTKKALDDVLSDVAADADATKNEPPTANAVRSRNRANDPATVYSVRIPVSRIEQLRVFAENRGVTPSALIRQWVDERLTAEIQGLTPN